jgi:hypothetical protein
MNVAVNFDKKMGALVLGSCLIFGTLAVISCTNNGTTSSVLNKAYQEGQLFCASQGQVFGIVDAATGGAYSVIGKSAAVVAAACKVLAAIPVVPPAEPTQVPAVAVVVAPGSGTVSK